METIEVNYDSRVLPDVSWPELRPFWDALADGRLVLPHCMSCGHFQWYPQAMCPQCLHQTFGWHEVTAVGTVFSFTTLRRSFVAELDAALPLHIVLVDVDAAAGVRMVMNFVGDMAPAIGQSVRIARTKAGGVFIPIAIPQGDNT